MAEAIQLEHIHRELIAIRRNTSTTGWFWRGILQGAGAVGGTIIAVALIGLFLSLIGVIPGLGYVAAYLSAIAASRIH